jgi:thioredoxin:protein disulfide reductase
MGGIGNAAVTRIWLSMLMLLALSLPAKAAVDANELLEPDKAFRFNARAVDDRTVEISYRIADGYYLYKEKIRLSASPAAVSLGAPEMPQGLVHEDAFFGKSEIYRKEVRIRVPVQSATERFKLTALSQGCADIGVCYVPHEQTAEVRLAAMSLAPGKDASSPLLSKLGIGESDELIDRLGRAVPGAPQFVSDESRFVDLLESGSLWAVLGVFFVAGLALTFTPCVLPMIPILSGIIVGERGRSSRRRGLTLSVTYVLGMAVTYSAIGIGAALSGQLLSAALQNPWVLGAFALVFVLLALSSFGLYDLRLPSGLHTRVLAASDRLPGGHIGGVALMGMLSAAIVSPCIAAPLAGALLYISQSRDVWLGGTALLAMALGMGVPLIAVGVSEGALLPRSGPWMHAVRQFFGVMLLAVALWIVSPVIPAAAIMVGWAALLIGSAMFLRAIDPLPPHASGWTRLGKGIGIMALIAGAALIVGALGGSRDPLAPLSRLLSQDTQPSAPPHFERIATLADLETRVRQSKTPVMLDFYADWCVSCKEMERFTFTDPRVASRLADFTLLQADVTAGSASDRELLKRFRLFGPPGIVFFNEGREVPGVRVIGYQKADAFLKSLDAASRRP